MKSSTKIITILLLVSGIASIEARPTHARIRLLISMEPLSWFNGEGLGGSNNNLVASSSYGIAPGIEAVWLFSDIVEAGVGFQWQTARSLHHSDGETGAAYSFIPLYAIARFNVTTLKSFKVFLGARIGYTFFNDSVGFRGILPEDSGGPLISSNGGLFAAGSLGVVYTLKNRRNWGLDLSASVGYGFFGAETSSLEKSYSINLQSMTVDFGIELRI